MKIKMRNDIMQNVLFVLDDGTKVWYDDMPLGSEMRKQANELLCPTKDAPDLGESSASDNLSTPAPKQVI